jgi:citrate synthase
MSSLKEVLRTKVEEHRPRMTNLLKNYGDRKIGEVTVSQAIGGMRGVKGLVTDISYLDPYEGIRFRGYTINEVMEKLPKPDGKGYPYVEGFMYLLLTGEIPTKEQALEVVEEFKQRSYVPGYVFDLLNTMPKETHPMTMFSTAILAMQNESVFANAYKMGLINKFNSWEYMYEDVLNLISRLPEVAGYIYRLKYKNGDIIKPDKNLDFGGNFAHMMGIGDPYDEVARMYFILHSDHESGNVSAHTTHLVASALSDAYLSLSAGINGLAGPLHGLANQEVLGWIQNFMKQLGGKVPTEEKLKEAVWDTLNSGQVIPGYGHAVLRKTDPRYTAQREYCLKYLPNDELFQLVSKLYAVVPDILREAGKAKNPFPNVDAQSGVIQWYYGLKEYDFYTVLFGIGRSLGVLANITWDRALGYPIERPKSVTTGMLEEMVSQSFGTTTLVSV